MRILLLYYIIHVVRFPSTKKKLHSQFLISSRYTTPVFFDVPASSRLLIKIISYTLYTRIYISCRYNTHLLPLYFFLNNSHYQRSYIHPSAWRFHIVDNKLRTSGKQVEIFAFSPDGSDDARRWHFIR